MIKTIIIDDEPLACALVREYLSERHDFEVVDVCHDGFQGLKSISEHQPDLIFLDIQMPKITGFEMLELLEEAPAVIFTTAFDDYAIKAFEASAVDYLLKPYSKERFDKSISKFLHKLPDNRERVSSLVKSTSSSSASNRVVIKDGSKIRIIPYQDIVVLEADDDYVKIRTTGGAFMKKKTMQQFEDALPGQQFVRVHRSFLLNISHITRLEPYEKNSFVALLKDGQKIPVSKTGLGKLKEVLEL